ncbi:uncharacterized protein CANTADRAFT_52449 [Suhomyces tanzawaensis NRRL Y-17324]|uniref:RNase III domain-containing protein n=1 Tax=Suhomyces tanzawaensis NRRL Y-17324 TaxID=984487 RepID=A0A1E4SG14_9ASCO|nr:uncharacterized protein CANTADRAFT_52449 [Suhomyces tanzawaensis NRRL Y-17324]ODV78454.1 hypothetical protein CANTADRAFT_52449 [Suhomyces tanzawaensis NRRL Y-17324]
MANDGSILIPLELHNLLATPWIKCHLYSLGADLLRLATYRKFNHLLLLGGGGTIKAVVHDITTFIKKELQSDDTLPSKQLRDLIFLSSNSNLYLKAMSENEKMTSCNYNIGSTSKWLYIFTGYLQLCRSDFDVEEFTDKIIDIYIKSKKLSYLEHHPRCIFDEQDENSFNILKDYFATVGINEMKLYNNETKYITLYETQDSHIYLPPLPRIRNKELLVKALMHKESYRVLLNPNHNVAKQLTEFGYDLNPKNYSIYRYELSFLDGLGDFFLARESSKLLYQLYLAGDYSRMHSHIYQMLRTILATNTLLSKLSIAYKLHMGLDDPVFTDVIAKDYLTYVFSGELHEHRDAEETRIYEEEFLGDYFESYVGALFIEQPEVAEEFVAQIYESILKVITQTLPPEVSYANWTFSIMGRSLVFKKPKVT